MPELWHISQDRAGCDFGYAASAHQDDGLGAQFCISSNDRVDQVCTVGKIALYLA